MLSSLFVPSNLFPSISQTTQKEPFSTNPVKTHRKSLQLFLLFISILFLFISSKVEANQYSLKKFLMNQLIIWTLIISWKFYNWLTLSL